MLRNPRNSRDFEQGVRVRPVVERDLSVALWRMETGTSQEPLAAAPATGGTSQVWMRKASESQDQHLNIISPLAPSTVHYSVNSCSIMIQYGAKYKKHKEWFNSFICFI